MKLFNKKEEDFSEASMSAFEELLLGKKKENGPVLKGISTVVYVTVVVATIACIFMAVLDGTGKAPSAASPNDKNKAEVTGDIDWSVYPESLRKLAETNMETRGFVAAYFDEKDKKQEVSLKGYKNGDTMPLFLQWDRQWGYLQYGGDFAGVTADGPMCIAMTGYHLTENEKFSPDKIIAFANEKGYYKKGQGTLPTLMTEGAAELGLSTEEITPSSENIVANLQNGCPLICYMTQSKFSVSSRYVVIHGYEEGYFLINDPTSIDFSEKKWAFTDLAPYIKAMWTVSAAI